MRLERLELRQGAAGGGGGGLSQEDTLALLEGLVSRREAALKEDFRRDTAARIQVRGGAAVCGGHRGHMGGGASLHPDMRGTALPLGNYLLCVLVSSSVRWALSCLCPRPAWVVGGRLQRARHSARHRVGVQESTGMRARVQALEQKGWELAFAVK